MLIKLENVWEKPPPWLLHWYQQQPANVVADDDNDYRSSASYLEKSI